MLCLFLLLSPFTFFLSLLTALSSLFLPFYISTLALFHLLPAGPHLFFHPARPASFLSSLLPYVPHASSVLSLVCCPTVPSLPSPPSSLTPPTCSLSCEVFLWQLSFPLIIPHLLSPRLSFSPPSCHLLTFLSLDSYLPISLCQFSFPFSISYTPLLLLCIPPTSLLISGLEVRV